MQQECTCSQQYILQGAIAEIFWKVLKWSHVIPLLKTPQVWPAHNHWKPEALLCSQVSANPQLPPAFLTSPPATPSTSKFQACSPSFHFSHKAVYFLTYLMTFVHSIPPPRHALPWVLHKECSSSPSQFHVTSPEKNHPHLPYVLFPQHLSLCWHCPSYFPGKPIAVSKYL